MKTNFRQGLQIRQTTNTKKSPRRQEFEGIISDNTLDSHYTRMSPKVLRGYAAGAESGVPLLPEHDWGGQPIGRTFSGSYNPETHAVTSKFYIQRNLNLSHSGYRDSNSYIESMQEGTTTDLSIGAYVDKETCDQCNTDVKRMSFFGLQFGGCANGHFPGNKVYLDKDGKEYDAPGKGRTEKTVTSTIQEARLAELSTVISGSNASAQVIGRTKEAIMDGTLAEKLATINLSLEDGLKQLNQSYGITRSDLDIETISLDEVRRMNDEKKTDQDQDDIEPETTDLNMIDLQDENKELKASLKNQKEVTVELRDKVKDLSERNVELEEKVGEQESLSDLVDKLEDEVAKKDAELKDYASRMDSVKKFDTLNKRYTRALELKRDSVHSLFIKTQGRNKTQEAIERKEDFFKRIDDYETLHEYEENYKVELRDLYNKKNRQVREEVETTKKRRRVSILDSNDAYR